MRLRARALCSLVSLSFQLRQNEGNKKDLLGMIW